MDFKIHKTFRSSVNSPLEGGVGELGRYEERMGTEVRGWQRTLRPHFIRFHRTDGRTDGRAMLEQQKRPLNYSINIIPSFLGRRGWGVTELQHRWRGCERFSYRLKQSSVLCIFLDPTPNKEPSAITHVELVQDLDLSTCHFAGLFGKLTSSRSSFHSSSSSILALCLFAQLGRFANKERMEFFSTNAPAPSPFSSVHHFGVIISWRQNVHSQLSGLVLLAWVALVILFVEGHIDTMGHLDCQEAWEVWLGHTGTCKSCLIYRRISQPFDRISTKTIIHPFGLILKLPSWTM